MSSHAETPHKPEPQVTPALLAALPMRARMLQGCLPIDSADGLEAALLALASDSDVLERSRHIDFQGAASP